DYFAIEEQLKFLKMQFQVAFRHAVNTPQRLKILTSSQVSHQHMLIQIGSDVLLPFFGLLYLLSFDGYAAHRGTNQIQNKLKERSFSGSVIAHQSKTFTFRNM